jgi:hypothetical protein
MWLIIIPAGVGSEPQQQEGVLHCNVSVCPCNCKDKQTIKITIIYAGIPEGIA